MSARRNALALATTAVGLGVGIVAERSILKRRRGSDPELSEEFGTRRGTRDRKIEIEDGARIFIEEAGPKSRTGAVFIHGSALRTDTWHYQLRGINSHRLVFYDLRGHGLSQPKGDSDYTIETMAADLAAVIADSKLDRVVVVGHSIGGMIALEYALRNAGSTRPKIEGLVLLNTTYAPAVETLTGGAALARLERATRRPLDFVGSQSKRIDSFRKVIKPSDAIFWTVAFAAFGPHPSPRQIDFTYDMLAETSADVIFDVIKFFRDFDVRDRLSQVSVPALVIGGTHDRLTVCKASEYIAGQMPNAELHLMDGCGHMSMLERHAELNGLLDRFLSSTLA